MLCFGLLHGGIASLGGFPEAFQNAAIIISDGCMDENDVNTYFLDNRVELASFYHEQSVIHAQDTAFRAGALSNLVNHKLKFGSFKNNAEIRATALALREALESINPTSSPETPWPRSAHFSLALLHNEVGDVEAYYATIRRCFIPNLLMVLL